MAVISHDITPLANYAREVVRDYLHLQGDEDEENRMWKGFRVSGSIIANQFHQRLTESLPEELERVADWPPICADDVLDVHTLLQECEGDLERLLAC